MTAKYSIERPTHRTYIVTTPALCLCPNGRIIASFGLGGKKAGTVKAEKGSGKSFVYTSDDHGQTFIYRKNFSMTHFRCFVAGERLYFLGHQGDVVIMPSNDWGETWGETVKLTQGQTWHGSAMNVWYKGDYVYLVLERRTEQDMKKGWKVSELAPVTMRA